MVRDVREIAKADNRPLQVRLVVESGHQNWILGKMAARLCDSLCKFNVKSEIAENPSADVDVNHWMYFGYAWSHFFQEPRRKLTKSTALVTHIDDLVKVKMLREVLADVVDVGICMSRMTVDDLVSRGVSPQRLAFVTPAHDGTI